MKRETQKGFIKRLEREKSRDFAGISSPYEFPENPEILLETDNITVDQSVQKILSYLEMNSILKL